MRCAYPLHWGALDHDGHRTWVEYLARLGKNPPPPGPCPSPMPCTTETLEEACNLYAEYWVPHVRPEPPENPPPPPSSKGLDRSQPAYGFQARDPFGGVPFEEPVSQDVALDGAEGTQNRPQHSCALGISRNNSQAAHNTTDMQT